MKALVIDDSRAIRRILVKTLKELDIEVVEAGHGQKPSTSSPLARKST